MKKRKNQINQANQFNLKSQLYLLLLCLVFALSVTGCQKQDSPTESIDFAAITEANSYTALSSKYGAYAFSYTDEISGDGCDVYCDELGVTSLEYPDINDKTEYNLYFDGADRSFMRNPEGSDELYRCYLSLFKDNTLDVPNTFGSTFTAVPNGEGTVTEVSAAADGYEVTAEVKFTAVTAGSGGDTYDVGDVLEYHLTLAEDYTVLQYSCYYQPANEYKEGGLIKTLKFTEHPEKPAAVTEMEERAFAEDAAYATVSIHVGDTIMQREVPVGFAFWLYTDYVIFADENCTVLAEPGADGEYIFQIDGDTDFYLNTLAKDL